MRMTASGRVWRIALAVILGGIAAMVATYIFVDQTGARTWTATQATVENTMIKSVRLGGPPEWALVMRFDYSATGRNRKQQRFTGREVRVFTNRDRDITRAKQAEWPAGRRFTIYYDPSNPAAYSLAKDGGRQALAVVLALLTPMALLVIWLGYRFVISRRFQA